MFIQYLVLIPESELKQDLPRKLVHLSKLQISDLQKEKEKFQISFPWLQFKAMKKKLNL